MQLYRDNSTAFKVGILDSIDRRGLGITLRMQILINGKLKVLITWSWAKLALGAKESRKHYPTNVKCKMQMKCTHTPVKKNKAH